MSDIEKMVQWNEQHPVGVPVLVKRDNGDLEFTRTRAAAGLVSSRAVLWLEGYSGCWDMSRVHPMGEHSCYTWPIATDREVYFVPEITGAHYTGGVRVRALPDKRLRPWIYYRVHLANVGFGSPMEYIQADNGVFILLEGVDYLSDFARAPGRLNGIDLSGFDVDATARLRHIVDGLAAQALEENARDFAREARVMVRRWEDNLSPKTKAANLLGTLISRWSEELVREYKKRSWWENVAMMAAIRSDTVAIRNRTP